MAWSGTWAGGCAASLPNLSRLSSVGLVAAEDAEMRPAIPDRRWLGNG